MNTRFTYSANDETRTIIINDSAIVGDHARILRDIGRFQWFTIGNGGIMENNTFTFHLELEEYNSVIRFLNKWEWVRQ